MPRSSRRPVVARLASRLASRLVFGGALAFVGCSAPSEEPLGSARSPVVVCAKGPTIEGIDVSSWQGTIDWGKVKASGKTFAIVRIGDGTYLDKQFFANWSGAKSVGLVRGAYQFFRPGQDVNAQASIVIDRVGKLEPGDLPVVVDVEATDGQSASTIVSKLHVWIDKVEAATGKKPIVYSGKYFWNDNVGSKAFADHALWIPAYGPKCPDLPSAWSDWKFFQYTDSGSVPGIAGNVDLDKFNGTLADLKAFAASSSICAPEVCNGKDDDCDGVVDDEDVCENDALVLSSLAYAPPRTTDVDGDGRADVCGRGVRGLWCHLSTGEGFGEPLAAIPISDAQGWADEANWATIRMGDVDGDGRADVCARANDAVWCWRSDGKGFGAGVKGPALSDASGWANPRYFTTIRLADVDGDGKDDLCARAATGVLCWRSEGDAFGEAIEGPAWSDASGFGAAKHFGTLRFADVNGDGKQDVCVRAVRGLECQLSDGKGFPTRVAGPDWSDAAGFDAMARWSTIRLADVNGDGKADACARTGEALECHFSDGEAFGPAVRVAALSDASGWADPSNYGTLRVGDVDGDGAQDLCLRANAKVLCYRWTGSAFAAFDGPSWSDADGWDAPMHWNTLALGDVDGDHRADLCARAAAGWTCAPSTGAGFGPSFTLEEFTNAGGWDAPQYAGTLQLGGTRAKAAAPPPPSDDAGPKADAGGDDAGASDGGAQVEIHTAGTSSGGGCSASRSTGEGAAGSIVAVGVVAFALRRRRARR